MKINSRRPVGKTAVVGIKGRDGNQIKANIIPSTKKVTLQGFIHQNVKLGSNVYTDDFKSYTNFQGYIHEVVKHSVGEYVNKLAHINGMEFFWAMMKRGYHGTHHWKRVKHLNRYVSDVLRTAQHPKQGYDHVGDVAGDRHGRKNIAVQGSDQIIIEMEKNMKTFKEYLNKKQGPKKIQQ